MNRRSFLTIVAALAVVPREIFTRIRNRFWYPRNGPQLTQALKDADDGDMIILEPGNVYKCPPDGWKTDKSVMIVSQEAWKI